MRRIAVGVLGLVALGVLGIAMLLTWAHHGIRLERGPLPTAGDVLAAAADETDRPVRLSYVETARQPMPRSAVLDPERDPTPDAPYVMSHPGYVLEWADGRILLVDSGMEPAEAESFGKPLEWMGGADPMESLGSLATQLAGARERVGGIVFTHLHVDHVGGLEGLCRGRTPPLPVFMTEAQSERPNYTTSSGETAIDSAGCATRTIVPGMALRPIPGFPGAFIIPAAGHTPGSEIVLVMLADGTRWALLGDIANAVDGVLHDVPKPPLYSLLIVPEDGERLGEVRRWLRAIHQNQHVGLLPAHDELNLRASGIPAFDPRHPPTNAPEGEPPGSAGHAGGAGAFG